MIRPDTINGLFQLGGAAFELYDVHILRRDKVVRGVHWSTIMFFITWNVWSLVFYSLIHQWFLFIGVCALFITNVWWLKLLIQYRRK